MKTAFLFPGQGSQFPAMGKDLFDTYSEAREVYKKANQISGLDIIGLSFEGSKDELSQTQFTQPAIFTHSWAVMEILGSKAKFDATAGHSLGEYSALCGAQVLSFEQGLKAVTLRGSLMSQAKDGGMIAPLGADKETVEAVAKELSKEGIIAVANYNAPGQFILSGEPRLFEKAEMFLKEKGAKRVARLAVSGAFHSPLMEIAREELGDFLQSLDFNIPKVEFFSNVSGHSIENPEIIREKLLAQLTSPVLWIDIITNMNKTGIQRFVEAGPGKILRGLAKRIDRSSTLIGAGTVTELKEIL